jgi:ABC-2 type transport system ATP-binding protein
VIFEDTIEAFNNYQKPNSIVVHMENPPALKELKAIAGMIQVDFLTPKQVRLEFDSQQDITEKFVVTSVEKNWRLTEIAPEKYSLDDIFAKLSKKAINNS